MTRPDKSFELEDLRGSLEQVPKGKKIVLLSGCFDLLHVGHVKFLNKCKTYGNVLVVAVKSDQFVSEKKGPSRPVISENNRAFMVSNLKCVDFVFIKREKFVNGAIDLISPDTIIFCKENGQDFSGYQKIIDRYNNKYPLIDCIITERENYGTDMGSSTTKIIKRILELNKNNL